MHIFIFMTVIPDQGFLMNIRAWEGIQKRPVCNFDTEEIACDVNVRVGKLKQLLVGWPGQLTQLALGTIQKISEHVRWYIGEV